MRTLGLVFVLLCSSIASYAQSAPKGVEVSDIEKSVEPCVDLYQYANGSWRAANPIPASMTRWSRRWAAGGRAKDQLREILEETSKRKDWPTGSAEQLIGDRYGSCDAAPMNRLPEKRCEVW